MTRRAVFGWLAIAGFALAVLHGSSVRGLPGAQDPLTPSESRGKQIYLRGASPAGNQILAYIGDQSLEVPGDTMPCANCHGFDGLGKSEGGVKPSDINWSSLTKPYVVTSSSGRRRPAYTDRGLELAITRGIDPGGNPLPNVMPRYQMSRADLADLIVYLKRLGSDRDPGISDEKIVIGTVVPATGPLLDLGQAVKSVIAAFFEEVNSNGGIYNRRLELKFVETGQTPTATRANVERLIQDEHVFALAGAFIAGSEKEIIPLMAVKETPLIGPLTLYPRTGFPLNRQVFYLLSGLDDQLRVLTDFAAKKPELKTTGLAIVYPQSEVNESVVAAIKDQSRKDALVAPEEYKYVSGQFAAAEAVNKLRQNKRAAVFLLSSTEEALDFMKEAEKGGWFPALYLPSSSGGSEIMKAPPGFNNKLFLSFPTSPADQTDESLKEFRALSEKYKLPQRHLAAQITTYSTCKILLEALKRSGRDVSREKLISTLEGFYEFRTGLTPAISYGPNRRIGALGAYVLAVDLEKKQFVPLSNWSGPN